MKNCEDGINAIHARGNSEILARSAFYKTEPVDFEDQDWFVNAAVRIGTRLEPHQLLDELKRIEKEMGRSKSNVRFGPRVLDLDIILYGDLTVDLPELTIPHPRMHKRRFVLRPMCDIDPETVHPILKQNMRSLLDNLGDDTQEVVPCL